MSELPQRQNSSPQIPLKMSAADAPPSRCPSSPPLFEPPLLPRTLLQSCSVATEQPVSTGFSTSLSLFSSPYSAFTELHPRHPRVPPNSQDVFSPCTLSSDRAPNKPLSEAQSTSNKTNGSGGHSDERSPLRCDTVNSSASSSRSVTTDAVYCRICGQPHDPNTSHRYNYTQAVDSDLCCMLCHQPLVEPLDTKCGHTFCTPCLKNHLAVQALCPVDRQIINYLECQQASKIVKRLLDKLLVACPNSKVCSKVVYRSNVEEHLRDGCAGTNLLRESPNRVCRFDGPCSSQQQQQQDRWHSTSLENPFTAVSASSSTTHSPSVPQRFIQISNAGHAFQTPVSTRTTGSASHMAVTHASAFPHNLIPSSLDRTKVDLKNQLPEIDETYDSPTIIEGTPVSIVVRRLAHSTDLGFTFVGGIDTPLSCILVQEIYLDGAVAIDGRLRPGDQILEINGNLLTASTHLEARHLLSAWSPTVQLTVFRESMRGDMRQHMTSDLQEEVFYVKLCKRQSKVLGIKLVGKKHLPGLYVLDLVPGCEAQLDGRLQKDDQILEINGIDLSSGTQEQAAHIINTAADSVTFMVSRRNRADTPDILRTTNGSNEHVDVSVSMKSMRLHTAVLRHKGSVTRRSVDQLRSVQTEFDECSKHQLTPFERTRSAHSDTDGPVSSHTSETSSLHAFPTPPVSETDITANSTSKLIVEDEDREVMDHMAASSMAHSPDGGVDPSPSSCSISKFPAKPMCRERTVVVSKSPDEPLGVSVAGGRQSQRGDTPIYVTNISPQCVLAKTKSVKRGDIILEVNRIGLVGLTHNEAVDVLRRASLMHSQIELRLIEAPETSDGPDNFMPSWTYWLQLPPICQLTRVIHLNRKIIQATGTGSTCLEPLGFSILGGLENETPLETMHNPSRDVHNMGYNSLYPCPIVLKSIVPGLLAHRDGRLRCGDLILAVNNVSMLNVSHTTAVRVLKRLHGDVALRVISWPGTIV
ncbi:E3 ubiquitin-protein ligase LNX [Paragonimus heterotremus]|uniref:E3 ubiquitin-protein ligase LNX n=1 Tax=Paragonimus heterotremus TaxID=100268 RepID=A0A8J4WKF2_9TREM|nr:E3 ubiquitin-protein ligase LNX [Paragonimus heterotremus]